MRISDWSSDVCSSDLPSASASFAETHVRRLEAIRRVTGGVEREADGTWVIAPDHLERAAAFERRQAQASPVVVRTLSPLPLERQVAAEGATWLDRELDAELGRASWRERVCQDV